MKQLLIGNADVDVKKYEYHRHNSDRYHQKKECLYYCSNHHEDIVTYNHCSVKKTMLETQGTNHYIPYHDDNIGKIKIYTESKKKSSAISRSSGRRSGSKSSSSSSSSSSSNSNSNSNNNKRRIKIQRHNKPIRQSSFGLMSIQPPKRVLRQISFKKKQKDEENQQQLFSRCGTEKQASLGLRQEQIEQCSNQKRSTLFATGSTKKTRFTRIAKGLVFERHSSHLSIVKDLNINQENTNPRIIMNKHLRQMVLTSLESNDCENSIGSKIRLNSNGKCYFYYGRFLLHIEVPKKGNHYKIDSIIHRFFQTNNQVKPLTLPPAMLSSYCKTAETAEKGGLSPLLDFTVTKKSDNHEVHLILTKELPVDDDELGFKTDLNYFVQSANKIKNHIKKIFE